MTAASRTTGDGALLRLGLQATRWASRGSSNPYFGLSISRVDPLPRQLKAAYDHLLKLARVRFLLADDAGTGKTIMAGLLPRELQLRGVTERILIVAPSNLAFQWQRELKEKFDETFLVMKGGDLRAQFGVNQWMQQAKVVTSLDLAKREDILPGLRLTHWDLVIVDEAHRMSARDESHKSQRYRLGELLRDSADHMLLLTATPHKGDWWAARRIFARRIPRTVAVAIDGPEFEAVKRGVAVREAPERQGSGGGRLASRPGGRPRHGHQDGRRGKPSRSVAVVPGPRRCPPAPVITCGCGTPASRRPARTSARGSGLPRRGAPARTSASGERSPPGAASGCPGRTPRRRRFRPRG